MTPSLWLFAFLKSFEQFRPTAYLPTPKDKWTIGYGHTHNVKEGDTCTLAEAEAFLHADVQAAVDEVNHLVKVALTQNQFDALVSFTFNVGAGDAAKGIEGLSTSTLLRKLNAGDPAGASAEFPHWNKQRGKVLDGLTKRRAAERAHFDAA